MDRCWKGKFDVQDARVKAKHLQLGPTKSYKSDLQSVENSYNRNKRYFRQEFLFAKILVRISLMFSRSTMTGWEPYTKWRWRLGDWMLGKEERRTWLVDWGGVATPRLIHAFTAIMVCPRRWSYSWFLRHGAGRAKLSVKGWPRNGPSIIMEVTFNHLCSWETWTQLANNCNIFVGYTSLYTVPIFRREQLQWWISLRLVSKAMENLWLDDHGRQSSSPFPFAP